MYGLDPDLTREGGSIPIANMLADVTGMNVMLLPVGACDVSKNLIISSYEMTQPVAKLHS